MYDLTFTMPAKSASFRVFVLDDSSSKWRYYPVCDPRGGELA
jgi:hypothetical protein